MTELETIVKQNQVLAEKINKEALANPQSPYAGKHVGIANGRVVAVADTAREVVAALDKAEPDRFRTLIFEASIDYDRVQYIWALR